MTPDPISKDSQSPIEPTDFDPDRDHSADAPIPMAASVISANNPALTIEAASPINQREMNQPSASLEKANLEMLEKTVNDNKNINNEADRVMETREDETNNWDDDDDAWGDPVPSQSAPLKLVDQTIANDESIVNQTIVNQDTAIIQETPDVAPISLDEIKNNDTEVAVEISHKPTDVNSHSDQKAEPIAGKIAELKQEEAILEAELALLRAKKEETERQYIQMQGAIGRLVQEGLSQLEQRKQGLQIEVEKLERRRERIQTEMRTSFAGVSQELAIRVQGFKDYLVGSLQDLAATAEQLDLAPPMLPEREKPRFEEPPKASEPENLRGESGFREEAKQIRALINQYRTAPDYYGPVWQLRRTFEPIHADRLSHWFFTQGGRGAIRTMSSRLQNILIGAATVSILRSIHGSRLRTLVLANTPERLGEWRRGLQDCLGISRNDFGPDRGVVLFEESEVVAQRADRLVKEGKLPLILIDETEDKISVALLQFPLWLAFAPDPQSLAPKERDLQW